MKKTIQLTALFVLLTTTASANNFRLLPLNGSIDDVKDPVILYEKTTDGENTLLKSEASYFVIRSASNLKPEISRLIVPDIELDEFAQDICTQNDQGKLLEVTTLDSDPIPWDALHKDTDLVYTVGKGLTLQKNFIRTLKDKMSSGYHFVSAIFCSKK